MCYKPDNPKSYRHPFAALPCCTRHCLSPRSASGQALPFVTHLLGSRIPVRHGQFTKSALAERSALSKLVHDTAQP
jgi:hypothetical protein